MSEVTNDKKAGRLIPGSLMALALVAASLSHLLGDLITHLGLGNGWFIVMLVSNLLLILGIWLVSAGWELAYALQYCPRQFPTVDGGPPRIVQPREPVKP